MSEVPVVLQLENLGYAFEAGNTAVMGIHLQVRAGQILLVAGANGSGKTSLLKLMGGYLLRTEGAATFCGTDFDAIPEYRLEEMIAFVRSESDKQLVGPTVEDEVARACRQSGLSGKAIPERVGEVLAAVGFPQSRTWYIDEMSTGERRRVAIASALVARPRLLLLDDPLNDLDQRGIQTVSEILRLMASQGLAVVFSAHTLEHSIPLADEILVLEEGEVLAQGNPKKVAMDRDRLTAAGLALPAATEICLRLRASGKLMFAYPPLTAAEAVEVIERNLFTG